MRKILLLLIIIPGLLQSQELFDCNLNNEFKNKVLKLSESNNYKLLEKHKRAENNDLAQRKINLEEGIQVTIEVDGNFCEDESTTLSAFPKGDSYSYEWSTGETTSRIEINSPGTYMVTVSNDSLSGAAEITLNQHPKPQFSINKLNSMCKLDTVEITINSDENEFIEFEYEIYGPTITALQSNRFIPQEEGTHKVYIRATNEFECSKLDSVEIEVEPIPETPEIVIDEATDKIYAVNIDNTGDYEFLWFRDEELIEITSSDTLIAQEKGIYTLKIRSITKDCDSDFSNEIKYNITSVVSPLDQVRIYPNPAESYLNVESNSLISRIEIVDELGRVIYESENNFNKRININEYSSGVYFVKIVINDKLLTRKIIIK